MHGRMMRMPPPQMQMPVTVGADAVGVKVGVHVQTARQSQPSDDEAENNQEAATDELATLLEARRNLPAEEQHEARADCKQQRMPDRRSQRKTECPCVPRGAERCAQRQRRNGHEVISAESVKKPEGEHRAGNHWKGL